VDIGKKLYVKHRAEWRAWLRKHHKTAKDIWLIYYKKNSAKPRIPYNDAVEEALCFGWIDSIVKSIDTNSYAQRFTPRKPNSQWSPMNIERLRRLVRRKKVTKAGMEAAKSVLIRNVTLTKAVTTSMDKVANDILSALKKDPLVWKNFQKFPSSYKRIRIGWIEGARQRPEVFRQRLSHFLKMTTKNKKFGMMQ
jgi:uncharacterized protein YdeI (YjbR/CyaY-like superfamily)